jgi:hypothetical protein
MLEQKAGARQFRDCQACGADYPGKLFAAVKASQAVNTLRAVSIIVLQQLGS